MVTQFGMSEIGPISLTSQDREVFLGRDLMIRSEMSNASARSVDEQVFKLVHRLYDDTVALLSRHRECMDRVVEVLIERESLSGDEFTSIVAEYTALPGKARFTPLLAG